MEFTPPEHMTFDGNLREHWKKWKQEIEFYMQATEKDKKANKVKSSILLTCIGPQGREIYNTFNFEEGEHMNFDSIIKQFDEYCLPKKNLTLIRHRFFTYTQKEGQSFSEFIVQLKKLSTDCEFNELKESLIRDMIIVGVTDDRLRERMLREPDLNLGKALQLGNSAEQTKHHIKELKKETEIDYIQKLNPKSRSTNTKTKTQIINNCRYCGKSHARGSCPAYGQNCRKCNKVNHFANVCLSKTVNIIEQPTCRLGSQYKTEKNNQQQEDNSFYISTIQAATYHPITDTTINAISSDSWNINLTVNNTNIIFKIDTGAQVNVISNKSLNQLEQRPILKPSNVKLTAYNGTTIPVKGHCLLNIQHTGKNYPLLFIVVETDSSSILGLRAIEKLNLIKRVNEISLENNETFFQQFDDCFDEIGTLPKIHHITIDPNIQPVIQAARKIPIALKDKLKHELDRMIRLKIIEPITEPTEWVSQLVVIEKANGKLRVCLDPRDLNKAIKRQHFKLPTANNNHKSRLKERLRRRTPVEVISI